MPRRPENRKVHQSRLRNREAYEKAQTAIGAKFQEQYKAIQRREDASKREIDLARELVSIKESGDRVEERSAAASLAKAQEDLKAATPYGKDEAQQKVDAANLELTNAIRVTENKREQARLESEIAELAGNELDQKQKALQLTRENLEREMARAKPDDKPGIQTQLDQNARELRGNAFELANARTEAAARSTDEQNPGKGVDEQRARLQAEVDKQAALARNNARLNGGDEETGQQIAQAYAAATAALSDFNYQLDEQLDHERATSREIELQIEGAKTLGDLARIEAEYNERIAKAQEDKNSALMKELESQKKKALFLEREEDYLKGPKGRREERKHEREMGHAGKVLHARDADAKDRKARRGGRMALPRTIGATSKLIFTLRRTRPIYTSNP
jgi:hypothetical protein